MEQDGEYVYNSTMLRVLGVDKTVTDDDFYQHFSQIPGTVVWCKIAKHRETHESLGYGYVNYSNPQEAEYAIQIFDSSLLKNNCIRVIPCHRNSAESILSIKNLDKSVDKHVLLNIFSKYGQILNMRVHTDASGQCSGTASVFYNCFEAAQTAIEHLDGTLIYNKIVKVCPVRADHPQTPPERLCVRFSSESSASKSHLRKFFSQYGDIAGVSEYTHHKGDRFGDVTFVYPEDAAMAARDAPNHKYFIRNFELFGKYKDAPERDQVDLKQLHVKNLHEVITDHSLKAFFSKYGCLSLCKVLRDSDGSNTGSGLVAFSTYKEASTALHAMDGRMIMGKTLCITLGKKGNRGSRCSQFQ